MGREAHFSSLSATGVPSWLAAGGSSPAALWQHRAFSPQAALVAGRGEKQQGASARRLGGWAFSARSPSQAEKA